MADVRVDRDRRLALSGAVGLPLALLARPLQAADTVPTLAEAVARWAGGEPIRDGRVKLDIAPLVENGHAVPLTVRVEGAAAGAQPVREIVVFNEKNPWREVLRCELTAEAGRAEVATRIRLATSQQLAALARLEDGTRWRGQVDVVVTLAACIED